MNKGFTLIELLGVILLLGIISTVLIFNGTRIISSSRASLSETQEDTIIDATKKYIIYNQSGLPLDSNSPAKIIKLSELSSAGYIDNEDIIDPKNNKVIDGCVSVSYNDTTNQYNFKLKTSGC